MVGRKELYFQSFLFLSYLTNLELCSTSCLEIANTLLFWSVCFKGKLWAIPLLKCAWPGLMLSNDHKGSFVSYGHVFCLDLSSSAAAACASLLCSSLVPWPSWLASFLCLGSMRNSLLSEASLLKHFCPFTWRWIEFVLSVTSLLCYFFLLFSTLRTAAMPDFKDEESDSSIAFSPNLLQGTCSWSPGIWL